VSEQVVNRDGDDRLPPDSHYGQPADLQIRGDVNPYDPKWEL
jgi:hypothetical protein